MNYTRSESAYLKTRTRVWKGKKRFGKSAYATEVRCRKGPEMDRAGTRTIPCHLHLDRSGSSQAEEVEGAAHSQIL